MRVLLVAYACVTRCVCVCYSLRMRVLLVAHSCVLLLLNTWVRVSVTRSRVLLPDCECGFAVTKCEFWGKLGTTRLPIGSHWLLPDCALMAYAHLEHILARSYVDMRSLQLRINSPLMHTAR